MRILQLGTCGELLIKTVSCHPLLSNVVMQKNPENKNPNNHNKIRSMPIPIEAEVVDVR
ncbi:unnamed protein product, partial [Bubo scandiacus]